MNAESDLGALGPGALSIVLEIADVRVCSARVASSRPNVSTGSCAPRRARKRTRPSRIAPAVREGFAAVETSRGRLGHWTRLSRDGKIEDYAIVAPKEWNFHPAGPFGVSHRSHGAGSCMRWPLPIASSN
jgi:hypothetical protein